MNIHEYEKESRNCFHNHQLQIIIFYFYLFFVSDKFEKMVYTETKPRGPISAMNSTPGPVYLLPGLVGSTFHDPRSVHSKQPAYSFGLRHGKYKDESSPGPCYFPNPKISRTGKDGTPQYSLYARRGDLKGDLNPGKKMKKKEIILNFI